MIQDEPFDELKRMVHKQMRDASGASSVEERVIAVGVLRAVCTDYLAAHAPDGWGAFGQHVSKVTDWAKRKEANKPARPF